MKQRKVLFGRPEIDQLIENLIAVAEQIRESIEELDQSTRRAKSKSNVSTSNQYEIDLIADNIIQSHLSGFPGYVISEERELDQSEIASNELFLVIDPIDGSTNASRRIGYWSFSAALVNGGEVVAGLVVDQVTMRKFIATKDGGAILLDKEGNKQKLDPALFVREDVGSNSDNFENSLIYFNSHKGPSTKFRHLRHFGSSALAICDVAAGSLDAYIDGAAMLLRPWDLLAGEYIAKSAGCKVLRRDSQGIMDNTGVLVARSEVLLRDFEKLFPDFY